MMPLECSQMSVISPIEIKAPEFIKSEEDFLLLQQHLQEIIEGSAFRRSHRSGQFLKYIVDHAAAGNIESLKERVIGVELFGRSPSYDTGDDAIVRVTASDVRKRLLQHYGEYGTTSRFHISLPIGSYIPEISRESENHENGVPSVTTHVDLPSLTHETDTHSDGRSTSVEVSDESTATPQSKTYRIRKYASRPKFVLILAAALLNLIAWGLVWKIQKKSTITPAAVLPWSALFNSTEPIQFISSDPDIAEIELYTGRPVSLSDYANHSPIPDLNKMPADVQRLWNAILRDNKSAFVDTQMAADISQLAQQHSKQIEVRAAKNLQLSDLQTNDNYILMGSPSSNPWSDLFSDQLDFRFYFDQSDGQEIIRNVHPRDHEVSEYIPTALGGGTGQSYAIIAFVQNPNQNGQILLIAGADAEGTEAAGRLATDLPRLSTALQNCGVTSSVPLHHFELLLRLNTMAGSPDETKVEACHILS